MLSSVMLCPERDAMNPLYVVLEVSNISEFQQLLFYTNRISCIRFALQFSTPLHIPYRSGHTSRRVGYTWTSVPREFIPCSRYIVDTVLFTSEGGSLLVCEASVLRSPLAEHALGYKDWYLVRGIAIYFLSSYITLDILGRSIIEIILAVISLDGFRILA